MSGGTFGLPGKLPQGRNVWCTTNSLSTTLNTGTATVTVLNPSAVTLGRNVAVGDIVFSSGNNYWGCVTAVASNASMTVTTMGRLFDVTAFSSASVY
jgi:hypothetical protein